MNFSITFLFIVTVSGFIKAVHGAAATNLNVLFNNGQPLYCGSNCCSAAEWDFIRYTAYAARRQLRGENDLDEENAVDGMNSTVNSEGRTLLTYPRECAALCNSYPPRRCMALKCLGYRDRMLWTQDGRCITQQTEFQNMVNTLAKSPRLGTNCKALMRAPLLMTCEYGASC